VVYCRNVLLKTETAIQLRADYVSINSMTSDYVGVRKPYCILLKRIGMVFWSEIKPSPRPN